LPPDSKNNSNLAFSRFLKFWRGVHGLNQEQLAEKLSSSQRHISRLENGSSRPSEQLAKELGKTLELGRRDSNHLLMAAGYVPLQQKIDFNTPELKWLRKAMMMTLRALDPYPTTLQDSSGKILMVNRGWVSFFQSRIKPQALNDVRNYYDFLFGQEGAGTIMTNWEDTLSVILMSLKQRSLFSDNKEDQHSFETLAQHPNVPDDWQQRATKLEPMASFRIQMEIDGQQKSFFSVSSTVGALGPTAYASEPNLSIQTLYPEDDDFGLTPLLNKTLDHPLLPY